MTVKQQLIAEIERIDNPIILVNLFEMMQLITQTPQKTKNNLILKFAGCFNDNDAQEMKTIINKEFNKIEGEW